MKPVINIVWLKRDVRLHDHPPLYAAIQAKKPVLLLYCFETGLIEKSVYSERHWRFVTEGLRDLYIQIRKVQKHNVQVVYGDLISLLKDLCLYFTIDTIFSSQETGIKWTFDRDKTILKYSREQRIKWHQYSTDGIRRAIKNRINWISDWYNYMSQPIQEINIASAQLLELPSMLKKKYDASVFTRKIEDRPVHFQKGGETEGFKYLNTFLSGRFLKYMKQISKPQLSRESCSRLSPYLAWGHLSLRYVYQQSKKVNTENPRGKYIRGFLDRLRWRSHFMQKFEDEIEMEYRPLNKGYINFKLEDNEDFIRRWKKGQTGIPLVDACMRCLITTGYLNFRMRAMLVSFFTHHLLQDWKIAAEHLGALFLDFEPGIHYPQIQMQAGITGINAIRIYNPVKQSQDHDAAGVFIKTWVPELQNTSKEHIHCPWEQAPLLQLWSSNDYPKPIVDVDKAARIAREYLWSLRKDQSIKNEAKRILKIHAIPRVKRYKKVKK